MSLRNGIMCWLISGSLAAFVSFALTSNVFAEDTAVEVMARQQSDPVTRTGKERLAGKATDEQRVNDCKVPEELRGSKKRPADCSVLKPQPTVFE